MASNLAVAQQIQSCTSCMLRWNGNGPVPFTGNPGPIMILSESPTRLNDRQHKINHTGEPSRILDAALRRQQILLSATFFCNVVSCWCDGKQPTVGQIAACQTNLKAQVQLCDPRVVLALGSLPLAVTSDTRKPKRTISNSHGRPFLCRAGVFKDRWIYPCWHPAAMAHTRSAEITFDSDIADFGKFYRAMSNYGWPDAGMEPWHKSATVRS